MPRLRLLLAVLLPIAVALLTVTESGPITLATALTAGLAIVLAICVLPASVGALAHIRAIALRERARRSVFVPLRDPDSSGRPRPRAPGAAAAAA